MIGALASSDFIDALDMSSATQAAIAETEFMKLSFPRVSIDSRSIEKGDLFIALRGERFDGHDFLNDVAAAGASAAVVEKQQAQLAIPQLPVSDSVQALGKIAAANRDKFNGMLVGITGSCGKTSVKEMVASIFSQACSVLATRGNLNNHIGVPLMLLELNEQHQVAVIEMGASAVGEIAYLASLARPKVALVNNIAPAHVEGFGSLANVAKAKQEIYAALDNDGIAIVNLDDGYAREILQNFSDKKVITYSSSKPAAVEACEIKQHEQGYSSFELRANHQTVSVLLPLAGKHNVQNALAAAACCIACGISLEQIQAGLEAVSAVPGRMESKVGIHGCKVVDDSYNANPASVKAALDWLSLQAGIKIFVLGDMAELGGQSEALHRQMGEHARKLNINLFITVGVDSCFASEAFNGERLGRHFDNKTEALAFCKTLADRDVTFLCKGSRSAGMEALVVALTENSSVGEQK